MADPTVLRASLNAVFAAVKAQLVSAANVPVTHIRIIARRKKPPPLVGDQDVLLRDRGLAVDAGNSDRHDLRIWRKLGVCIRTRYELDETDSDEIWMTHATAGNVVAEESVVSALQNFIPEDANRNTMLFEAMKLVGSEVRDRDEKDYGWGEVELQFHMGLEMPVDQSWA